MRDGFSGGGRGRGKGGECERERYRCNMLIKYIERTVASATGTPTANPRRYPFALVGSFGGIASRNLLLQVAGS